MSLDKELAPLDGMALAALVKKGEVKPTELVDAAIARIERVNPQLNAVIRPMFDEARKQAAGELPGGPFRGVPFLLKDLIAQVKGIPMASGSRFSRTFVPDHETELVGRLRKAGLVFLGKTNTPEFGIMCTTEPHAFGATKNPWDPTRSPGGSSGGAAAAVASGMVPMAHGGDGGGSIRIPASCCGLFGLKPTRARNPAGPDVGDILHGYVVEHALTRSVRDSAALLDATEGPDVGAPYWAPPKARPFLDELGTPPGKLRIAFTHKASTGTPVHADCVAAVHDAAKLLTDLGHEVVEGEPTVDANMIAGAFIAVWAASAAHTVELFTHLMKRKPVEGELEPLTAALHKMGSDMGSAHYSMALTALQNQSRRFQEYFVKFDLVLTPTLAELPPTLGTFDAAPGNPMAGLFRAASFTPFTPFINATGQPAMSVPLYWNAAGLPVGTQLVGRFGDEATLFRVAAQLEEARPWARRRPPIFAEG
jgi:amidase